MPLDVAAVMKQIDKLEEKRAEMRKRSKHDDLSDLPDWEVMALATLQIQLIERLAPPGSGFRKATRT